MYMSYISLLNQYQCEWQISASLMYKAEISFLKKYQCVGQIISNIVHVYKVLSPF